MADNRCETCFHWEQPPERPGLHQCLSEAVSAAVDGRFIATFRHEGCQFYEQFPVIPDHRAHDTQPV